MTLVLVSQFLKLQDDRLNLKLNEKEECREKGVPAGSNGKIESNGGKGSQPNCEKGKGKLEGDKQPIVGKGGRSPSSKSCGANLKKQACVVTCNLPDVELDGQWGIVISHGAEEVTGGQRLNGGGAPVILRLALQSSSTSSEESVTVETENVTESQAKVLMEMESCANDVDELVIPNEHDEAQRPSEVCEENDMMKKTMGSSRSSMVDSSPNCTAEICPTLGSESDPAPATESAQNQLNVDKSQNEVVESSGSSNGEKMSCSVAGTDASPGNRADAVDDEPKSDSPTKKLRSSQPKLRKKSENVQRRRSSRLSSLMGADSIKADKSTSIRRKRRRSLPSVPRVTRSQSQKDMLSICTSVVTHQPLLKNKRSSQKKSTGLSIKNKPSTKGKTGGKQNRLRVPSKNKEIFTCNVDSSGRPICPTCSKTFVSRSSLRSHLVIHTKERNFKCPHCGKCFTQLGTRNRHVIMMHKKKSERPSYKCPEPQCSKVFHLKSSLKAHVMSVHTKVENKPFRCPECPNLGYVQRRSLEQHIKRYHKD